MSVEGLLNEAKHFHANNLDVAFGEQLFFGGKRVFSSFQPQTSNNDNRKDNKKDGKGKGAKNELKEAIGQAKNIVNQALQGTTPTDNENDFATLRKSHDNLTQKVEQLASLVSELQLELASLRQNKSVSTPSAPAPAPAAASAAAADDDFDLFGSEDEEDEEKKKVVEERLKAYAEKKSKKPGPIAKSSIILDVKPWDDETDLGEMEKLVRGIELDGLVWGGSKLIEIGYGIKKLQIICVVEDLKVSVDDLTEKITGDFEDHVQSVDIVAFNKI